MTRLAGSTDAKGMLCKLVWQHELAPTYDRAWQLMDFSPFLTATDKMALRKQPFEGCKEFETSMVATYEDILCIEAESDPDLSFAEGNARQYPQAENHLLFKRIELGARAAGVEWPGALECIKLPTVKAIELEVIPPRRSSISRMNALRGRGKERTNRERDWRKRPARTRSMKTAPTRHSTLIAIGTGPETATS